MNGSFSAQALHGARSAGDALRERFALARHVLRCRAKPTVARRGVVSGKGRR